MEHIPKETRCINCEKIGHIFKNCTKPVISYGLVAFRINNNIPEYLVIQRKDTIGYTDFIRGKYDTTTDIVKLYIQEMTYEEIHKIRSYSFRMLWDDIFFNKKSNIYKNEYARALKKFESIDVINLTEDYYQLNKLKYHGQEYGFPKGRKNFNEDQLVCAMREFAEETGYSDTDYTFLKNIIPHRESYIGIDNKNYIHKYYVVKFNNTSKKPHIDTTNYLQYGEIKSLKWMNFRNAYNTFRDYHMAKKGILYKINKYVTKNHI